MHASATTPRPSTAQTFTRLLLAAALTALTLGVDIFLSDAVGVQQVLLRTLIIALLLYGLWRGLGRAMLSARTRVVTWWTATIVLLVWQAVAWALAVAGAFQPGVRVPGLPLAIFLPLVIGLPLLLRSTTIGRVLDATPPAWLIGLQVYRVFGSVFLVTWAAGGLPTAFALPAGLGDTLVGLLALPVALFVGSGARYARGVGVAWNLLGLLDLLNAVTLGTLTSPGVLQLIRPDHATSIGFYPLVLIPAFAVPLSILLHALSLRQLRRLGDADRLIRTVGA